MWNLFSKRNRTTTSQAEGPSFGNSHNSSEAFPCGIKLLQDAENTVVDIVFIHGLTGDRENTWRATNEEQPWPSTLLPSEIPDARVLAFGYDASVTNWRGVVSQNRIGNHAGNLLTALATYRDRDNSNDRPIIFVCHSLGGLVCEDALVTARQRPEQHLQQILACTHGIVFLGTPHHGAGLAQWGELLARHLNFIKQANSEIVAVLRAESEVLARIQDSFHTMIRSRNQEALRPIQITCFFEELPVFGLGVVVPLHSAVLSGYTPIGIQANHMDMTKFSKQDDSGFLAVVGELRRWTRELRSHHRQPRVSQDVQQNRTHHVHRTITQGGSDFRGPTNVSGGFVFQGNMIGSDRNIFTG